MSTDKTSKTRSIDMFAVRYDDAELRAMARQQAENFWRAQERALDHLDGMTKDWLARRRQGTEAALETARKLCGCKEPAEISSVCGEWMTGSAERLADDARALGERTMKMLQDMAEAATAPAAADAAAKSAPEEAAETPPVKFTRVS
jgi:hypothetical protein